MCNLNCGGPLPTGAAAREPDASVAGAKTVSAAAQAGVPANWRRALKQMGCHTPSTDSPSPDAMRCLVATKSQAALVVGAVAERLAVNTRARR